jgi:hypothetical protein
MSRRKITLEAGTCGDDVFIAAPTECYDEAESPLTKKRLHILRFTTDQARAVCDMLRGEIRRQERKKKTRKSISGGE